MLMPFKNREQAADLLVSKLEKYRGKNPLILGIPRGAMPMAKTIANQLKGEVDVVLVTDFTPTVPPNITEGVPPDFT